MAEAKSGDSVKVQYTGKVKDGEVFESTQGQEPFSFTIGEGAVLPAFENAVVGMSPGESKKTEIAEPDAYGPRRDELVAVVERSDLPPDLAPQVGQVLQMPRPDGGGVLMVEVTDTSGSTVTLDANHPLSGRDLVFEIELVSID